MVISYLVSARFLDYYVCNCSTLTSGSRKEFLPLQRGKYASQGNYTRGGHSSCQQCTFLAGEVGIDVLANSLELGCDCPGEIRYFDTTVNDAAGSQPCPGRAAAHVGCP